MPYHRSTTPHATQNDNGPTGTTDLAEWDHFTLGLLEGDSVDDTLALANSPLASRRVWWPSNKPRRAWPTLLPQPPGYDATRRQEL